MYKGNHPFRRYSEQLKILMKDKKLDIEDPYFAVNTLQHYSYYNIINGYKDLFLKENKEEFKQGTTFEMLYQTQWIDMEMSSLLFKYSLLVEKKLKTRVSYLIAKKYGEQESDYLKSINYSVSRNNRGKLSTVKEAIDKNRNIDISAIHYMETENNLLPWIAAKAISFGDIYTWYTLLKLEDKINIINNFCLPIVKLTDDEKLNIFNRLIGQVYRYRNLSAHGNRNYKLKIDKDYELPYSTLKKMELENVFDTQSRRSLFSVILSIFILIDDPFAVKNFQLDLTVFFEKYDKEVYIFNDKDIYDLFDFSHDFLERLKEYVAKKRYREKYYD